MKPKEKEKEKKYLKNRLLSRHIQCLFSLTVDINEKKEIQRAPVKRYELAR